MTLLKMIGPCMLSKDSSASHLKQQQVANITVISIQAGDPTLEINR